MLIPILIITVIPLSITETVSMSMALSQQGKNAGAASALLGFFTVAPGSLTMPLTGIAGEDTALPLGLLMAAGYALCLASYRKWVYGKYYFLCPKIIITILLLLPWDFSFIP